MQRRPSSLELPFAAKPAEPRDDSSASARATVDPKPVLTVAELDRRLKWTVERGLGEVDVEGEVSGLKVTGKGHAYFTLKDEREEATIDCVMFGTAPARSRRVLEDGARVVLSGRVTVYVARGRLQLVAETARLAGRGAALEALERLKTKLAEEGIFAIERKRPLPPDPRLIGVVTSADGAVLHDIVKVAARRGAVRILLARAPVQGAGAAQRIQEALATLEKVAGLDAIIVARGGGSAEDLAAFNDEALVRAIARSRVPVVSAIGHEVDVTLTDLAADARASTPSQAAELLVPDDAARRAELDHLSMRLHRGMSQELRSMRHQVERLASGLGSPERLIAERQQQVDEARMRLREIASGMFSQRRATAERLERRLAGRHPRAVLSVARGELLPMKVRLSAATRGAIASQRRRLAENAGALDAMSPLAVLSRGYAIATDAAGRAIVDVSCVAVGDRARIRVHRGAMLVSVVEVAASGGNDAEKGPGT